MSGDEIVLKEMEAFQDLLNESLHPELKNSPILAELFEFSHNTVCSLNRMLAGVDLTLPEVRVIWRTHNQIFDRYISTVKIMLEHHYFAGVKREAEKEANRLLNLPKA